MDNPNDFGTKPTLQQVEALLSQGKTEEVHQIITTQVEINMPAEEAANFLKDLHAYMEANKKVEKPTATELEGYLKAGNITEFEQVLATGVRSNMEWREADTLLRDLGKLNEADRKTQPNLPGIELVEEKNDPDAGILAVVLTRPDATFGNYWRDKQVIAGEMPFDPKVIDPKAPSPIGANPFPDNIYCSYP
jgi:hypothetical protein